MRFSGLYVMVLLGLMGCKAGSEKPDLGPGGDGFLLADIGAVDNEVPTDGQREGGPRDGGQTDTGQTDAILADIGSTDGGGQPCDPNFGQAQACGGALLGTQWQYRAAVSTRAPSIA